MSRIRQKTGDITYSNLDTGFKQLSVEVLSERFYESNFPGSCVCNHTTRRPGLVGWVFPDAYPPDIRGKSGYMRGLVHPTFLGWPIDQPVVDANFSKAYESHINSLNWRKLDSSASVSLIQTLAEFDETLALFTKRFWDELSYGSITWGIVPFVHDVVNWAHTVRKAFGRINGNNRPKYSASSTFSYTTGKLTCGTFDLYTTVDVEISRSGRYELNSIMSSLEWLDRLGFHPDLATVYDLVPYSFALDYFLPIGTFLTNTFQRGWVNEISYSGWLCQSFDYTYKFVVPAGSPHWATGGGVASENVFTRTYDLSILHTDPVRFDIPEFNMPSLLQIFNSQYLLLQKFGRPISRKKIVYTSSGYKRL